MSGTVLLTGATGFVGRQIHRTLAERAMRVRAVIRPRTDERLYTRENLVSLVTTTDLFAESEEWWSDVCRDIDVVIHAAWYVAPGKYLQSSKNIDCLIGTLRMAKGAVSAGVRRFVGIGTCFEYDVEQGTLSAKTMLKPKSPYAGCKAAAFLALSSCLTAQSAEFAWCRLFYLYGDGEAAGRLVPYLRTQLVAAKPAELTSGAQVRDYLDVRDAGRMIADIALGDRKGAINVCSGIPITVRRLAEQIADEYGRRDLLRFGARPDNDIDPPFVVGIKDVEL